MNPNSMHTLIIQAAKLSGGSRAMRVVRRPVQTIIPHIMRKLALRRNVNLKTVWGGTFSGVLPEAVTSQIWRSGTFELPVSLSLLHFLKPGGGYIDVGSHFGYFALLASKLVGLDGRVLAIEAMPSTFKHLSHNVNSNAAFPNITMFQGAAYSEQTELTFQDFGVVASSLNTAFAARDTAGIIREGSKMVKVHAQAVDSIANAHDMKRIDLVKIDAESSEQFVLMGLKGILNEQRPVIVMEVGDANTQGDSVQTLFRQMKQARYSAYKWSEDYKLEPFELNGYVSYANVTFCPTEMVV